MITETLIAVFELNLNKLITEIEGYKKEDDLWKVEKTFQIQQEI